MCVVIAEVQRINVNCGHADADGSDHVAVQRITDVHTIRWAHVQRVECHPERPRVRFLDSDGLRIDDGCDGHIVTAHTAQLGSRKHLSQLPMNRVRDDGHAKSMANELS